MDEPGKIPECDRNRIVEVPFTVKAVGHGEHVSIAWTVDYQGDRQGNRLAFSSKRREMFNMRFRIEPNEINLLFPDNPLAAFWVAVDESPAQASYVRDFEPVSVSQDKTELLVLNINRSPANYQFSINFESDLGPLRLVSTAAESS